MSGDSAKILILDDDPHIRRSIARVLTFHRFICGTAADLKDARAQLSSGAYDLVLCDIRLPGESGLDLLKHIKQDYPDIAVLMITGIDQPTVASEAFELGAVGYLVKPFQDNELIISVSNALKRREIDILYRPHRERLERAAVEEAEKLAEAHRRRIEREGREVVESADFTTVPVVMSDPATKRVFALAENVAKTPATVLLLGESGTGKEVVASFIHSHSSRRGRPLVAVNCAAVPSTLMESELFGHEKGAFTGAVQRHIGFFERANGSTLLLDEISEISPEMQAKLLRVLQERTLARVGGSTPIKLDIRLIATTNRDLRQCVRDGTFRLDLYYRLNVFPIRVPPLRDRRQDIKPLARHFLSQMGHVAGPVSISNEALALLERYPYPGNVRELFNVLERAAVLAQGAKRIGSEHIHFDMDDAPSVQAYSSQDDGAIFVQPGEQRLEDIQREVILRTLEHLGGNRTKTAEALGVSLRTIRNKLRKYREEGFFVPPKAGSRSE
jgi:DNA-binding NtrC family response regulator